MVVTEIQGLEKLIAHVDAVKPDRAKIMMRLVADYDELAGSAERERDASPPGLGPRS